MIALMLKRPAFPLSSLTLLALAFFIFQGANAEAQSSAEVVRSIQDLGNDLYRKVAPGIVSVEVVQTSIPAWAIASLEQCANQCRLQPWRRGDLSEDEMEQWRGWCDSFLSHTETKLSQGGPLPKSEDVKDWHAFFKETLDEWVQAEKSVRDDQQVSFKRFGEVLSGYIAKLGDHLEQLNLSQVKPLTLRQTTGFVIDKGLVVTTMDVARLKNPYERIRVWSDSLVAYSTGEVKGQDTDTNLALIQLQGNGANLLPTVTYNPEKSPRVGDFVYAFWHAFGQPVSMRSGEISGVLRKVPFFPCATFLETSLPTSPGTLGAPLVNLDGELVGMGTVYMAQGSMSEITFALPAQQLMGVAGQLRDKGVVQRGRLGIYVYEVSDTGHQGKKVVVKEVEPESTAARHGVKSGDVIVSVNKEPIRCKMTLIASLSRFKANDMIVLEVDRQGQPSNIELDLDPMPPLASNK